MTGLAVFQRLHDSINVLKWWINICVSKNYFRKSILFGYIFKHTNDCLELKIKWLIFKISFIFSILFSSITLIPLNGGLTCTLYWVSSYLYIAIDALPFGVCRLIEFLELVVVELHSRVSDHLPIRRLICLRAAFPFTQRVELRVAVQ